MFSSPLRRLLLGSLLVCASQAPASQAHSRFQAYSLFQVYSLCKDQPGPPATLRWAEGMPGCTFSADDDGKYRYGLWNDDFGVVVAMDSQELEKMRRRTEPVFALFLTVRNRGDHALGVNRDGMSLEFVGHYHARQNALDPDELAAMLQGDTESFAAQTERALRKHPEKEAGLQAALADRRKELAEMQSFLKINSLQDAVLTRDHAEVTGWVFFSARSRWVGENWKKQEEFVLRLLVGERVVEFRFMLPPSAGDLLLRRREKP